MIIVRAVKNLIQYIVQGFTHIFSLSDDQYPAIGIQPYSGIIEVE